MLIDVHLLHFAFFEGIAQMVCVVFYPILPLGRYNAKI